MDKYIELMAFYWVDWQQTAIANTRYSVVLAVTAFFIGTFILAILKSGKIKKLQQQLLQNRQLLDEAKTSNDALVKNKAEDATQITNLQLQLEDAATNLQAKTDELKQQKDSHFTAIAEKDELFLKSVKEKQLEINELNSKFIEKNQLSEQLQNELNEQKDNIAQFVEVKGQVQGLELKLTEAAMELTTVKSQLDTELTVKDELLIKVDKQEQSTKSQIDRVLELEGQISELSSTQNIETAQRQYAKKKQAEKEKLALEKKKVTVKAEPVNLVVSANTKSEKQGIADKVLGWFSSMDKALEEDAKPQIDNEEVENPKVNMTEEIQPAVVAPDPMIAVKDVEPMVAVKEVIKADVKKVSKIELLDDEESSFSEKLAEVADKMDSLQGKLKGFFSKKKT